MATTQTSKRQAAARPTRPDAPRHDVADSLETDGRGCPMAHCNREDTSYHNLPPLLRVQTIQKVTDPAISPRAGFNLGAFTGEAMAVCAYPSPGYPALVAYDYTTGAVRWTSPLEDLSGIGRRRLAHLLLAKMALSGCRARPYVFAANPTEFVAYTA